MRRSKVTREEAQQIIDALLARRFDTTLPALSTAATYYEWHDHLAELPLAQTLPLHGRAMFAPAALDATARQHAAIARTAFFAELGTAVGVSARVLHAAVQARRLPLVPPRPVPGYDYLGTFLCEGKLDIADPCHLRKTCPMPPAVLALSYPVEALAGTWHVFIRGVPEATFGQNAELAVMHDSGFEVVATERITAIAVDAGVAGVFARDCPPLDMNALGVEGVVHGRGAYAQSNGDGVYPVFAGYRKGQFAKLRIAFCEASQQSDATVPVRDSKPYAAAATFAVGDAIEHPKFGMGMVMRVAGNKIDVRFGDDLRTLIHGRR